MFIIAGLNLVRETISTKKGSLSSKAFSSEKENVLSLSTENTIILKDLFVFV